VWINPKPPEEAKVERRSDGDDQGKLHSEEKDGDKRRRSDHPIIWPAQRSPDHSEQGLDDDHEHRGLDADECRLDERHMAEERIGDA
jgi:hypothetical protein